MVIQIVPAAAGVWLMFSPAVLDYAGTGASDVHRVAGPITASVALVAVFAVMRPLRWVNVAVGSAVAIAQLLVSHPAPALASGVATAVAIVVAAPLGKRHGRRYGGGWRAVLRGTSSGAGVPGRKDAMDPKLEP